MKKTLLLILFALIGLNGLSQEDYAPTASNLEARVWFEDAKFGLFIHWGVYSILGDGEWVMQNQNISVDNYEKLPTFFNPIEYNADAWVKMAKNAGMKYITITSRHHDGFSMFDSQATDYTIVKSTPYKKDILKELATACRKEGIKLFFYYSLLDWNRDDYFPRGRTAKGVKGRSNGEWSSYIKFMKAQLTELLTNYGEIGGIWFDGHWDKKTANWHYDEIYKLIHDLQPQCLIGNNHHEATKMGEDFQMFEKDLPGKATQNFASKAEDIGQLPKEVCETINGSWGFNLQDNKHKSRKELIQYLINAAGYGSNLLLNVGPMPNGKIQSNHVKSLEEIGSWLKVYGETIYGTRAGTISPTEDMVSTQKGKILYLHWLNKNKDIIFIPGFNEKISSIKLYGNNQKLRFKKDDYGLTLKIPESVLDPIDTIIEITIK
ncbi:alpha-L-fucosidase [Seonamhaeicola maritimus]|uniref:alpha-L-fucosidase n=1 Tax=Seonamhaeicola maritimus TaxID=2591822 RepID=A0A5C7GLB3_9FLAO|nr:alpha-L-fucosidase [Seonamhaeicola maritimus]TXG39025.1 alpha-L-fucosidase [Seonamhaeicola maritimus]